MRTSGCRSSTDPLTNDTKALNVSSIILFSPSNPQPFCQPLSHAPLQECGHSSDRRVIESRPAGAQQCRNSSVRSREGAVQSAELLQQTTFCCCCCCCPAGWCCPGAAEGLQVREDSDWFNINNSRLHFVIKTLSVSISSKVL